MSRTVAVLNALARPLLEPALPGWLEPRWFATAEDLFALAPQAEIGWFDGYHADPGHRAVHLAERLRWLTTVGAGVDTYPLDLLRARGVTFTNGAGLNAVPIAEYVVMGMLAVAKGYREVVRAQERHEWLHDSPGKVELHGGKAVVLGAGAIGGRVAELLRAFGMEVVTVRRTPAPGALGPDEWRARLGEFDWVIVAVASTEDTRGMIGAAELAAMKPDATLVNVSRGFVVDAEALLAALRSRRIGAAFLDVTDPEPLPADHPLWDFDNVHITMHLSGRAQTLLIRRGAERFLANLERYRRGEPLSHTVDLKLGY